MTSPRFLSAVLTGFYLVLCSPALADTLFDVERQLWKPAPDDVYLQEVAQKIPTDSPIQSIAAHDGAGYAVMDGKLYVIEGENLTPVQSAPQEIQSIQNQDGSLWALTKNALYRLKGDSGNSWEKIADGKFVDLCMHNGVLHAATREDAFRLENGKLVNIKPEGGYLSSDITLVMEDGTQVISDPVRLGPIMCITSYSSTLYALRPGKVVLFDGRIVDENTMDWGALPSPNTRDMLAQGSRLFIATDRGLAVLRGAAMTTLTGEDGLPYEDTTCLAEGFNGDLWIGTTTGAIRMLKDDWHYFGAHHWLPGDNVRDIAVDGKTVYIATDHGIGIIRYEPYTLRKKADYYERHIDEWGHKRLGFIHTLYWGGDDKGWIREISDNDGGHTAPYLAAMAFKYAVTGDESAREAAVDTFKAMVWLDEITPKDGFIARAIWSTKGDVDRRAQHGSGGLPAKWYPTDDGLWYWKGDTSSDEVDAHFYSVSIFHDLVANDAEKKRAQEHLARIAAHIVDNGWVMRDMDGKPTRWGRWDPQYLFQPYGMAARGLNGMEAQTIVQTAYSLTGEEKFKKAFQQLIDWGYHTYTVRQKITFPPSDIAPWDDNLAFRSYYTLIRYADDPILRSIYLRSLERTWEVKRMEKVSWYNFAYSIMTGNDGELDVGINHLREWTLDCTEHSYKNSHRADLAPEPGYIPYGGGTRGMSPRETSVKRGSRDALPYDGHQGGRRVMEPSGFLRDYWMARYHGIIEAPSVTDKELISVKPRTGQTFGSPPYDGPERPEISMGEDS